MAGVSNAARIPTRLLRVLTRWWSRPSGMNFASWTSRSSKNKCGATCSWTPRTFLIWPKPGKRDSATAGSGGGRLWNSATAECSAALHGASSPRRAESQISLAPIAHIAVPGSLRKHSVLRILKSGVQLSLLSGVSRGAAFPLDNLEKRRILISTI